MALAVLLTHSGELPLTANKLVGGQAAVQSFFMISGFYMALVLGTGYRDVRSFYFNRLLRIFPTYWLVLIGLAVAQLIIGHPTFVGRIMSEASINWEAKLLMLVANIMIFGSDTMMFFFGDANGLHFTTNFNSHKPLYILHAIPPAWSLPLELMFYAVAPFVVRNKARLIVLVMASLLLRLFLSHMGLNKDPWSGRFFPNELVFFCIGALAFHAYVWLKQLDDRLPPHFLESAGLVALIGLVVFILNFDRAPPLLPAFAGIGGKHVQLYVCLGLALPLIFHATRHNTIDRWIGELSYPIYIVHMAVIGLIDHLPMLTNVRIYNILFYSLAISVMIATLFQGPLEARFKRGNA